MTKSCALLIGDMAIGFIDKLTIKCGQNWDFVPLTEKEHLPALAARADALISPIFSRDMPAYPKLQLLQVPLVGCDGINFDAVPAGATVWHCGCS